MTTSQVRIATISQQVYEILKQRICAQEYDPGFWLQEKELAAQLNVSRSPVREALRMLVADGLAKEISNKGVFVRSFTPSDIEDIYEVREALERCALESLEGKLTNEEKETLRSFIPEFEKYHAYGDLERYIEVDTRFHSFIVKCSNNKLMMEVYEKIGTMSMRFRVGSLKSQQRFDDSLNEHKEIAEFLINGDIRRAREVMTVHLKLARDEILSEMKETV